MKKIRCFISALTAFAAVLSIFVFSGCSVQNDKGEAFKVRLSNLCYDSALEENMRFVPTINEVKNEIYRKYAEISVGDDGYAVFTLTNKKPKTDSYIEAKAFSLFFVMPEFEYKTKYYEKLKKVNFTSLHGQFSVDAEGYIDAGKDEIYAEVRIYRGEITVMGYYCDGEKAEDILTYYDSNFDSIYQSLIS